MIFKTYSNGLKTNRDPWAFNFNRNTLLDNIQQMIETYNAEVVRWSQRTNREANVDDFVVSDETKISWSGITKTELRKGKNR